MTNGQMKRMIGINVIALINIASCSTQLFYRIHSLLIEYEILIKSNEELFKSFSFNLCTITIHATNRDVTIVNFPLIFSLSALVYNAIEVVFAYARNRFKNKDASND